MDGGGGVEVVEVVVEWEMGGVGKAENECVVVFVHRRASLSLSDPETEFTGLGLATIGGCIAPRFGIWGDRATPTCSFATQVGLPPSGFGCIPQWSLRSEAITGIVRLGTLSNSFCSQACTDFTASQ